MASPHAVQPRNACSAATLWCTAHRAGAAVVQQCVNGACMQAASTVTKVQETRSTRTSGSFRRGPATRLRTPPGSGPASATRRPSAAPQAAPGKHESPLAPAGPHTVSPDAASPNHPGGQSRFTLPGAVISSSASGEARPLLANDPASAPRGPAAEGGAASAGSGKEARSNSNSGVLRGVVVLGEGGQPVLVDEDARRGSEAAGGAGASLGDNSSRSARSARRSTHADMMELELVKSSHGDAPAMALFRAVTPAESARRQQPGWWDGADDRRGAASLSHTGSTEYDE